MIPSPSALFLQICSGFFSSCKCPTCNKELQPVSWTFEPNFLCVPQQGFHTARLPPLGVIQLKSYRPRGCSVPAPFLRPSSALSQKPNLPKLALIVGLHRLHAFLMTSATFCGPRLHKGLYCMRGSIFGLSRVKHRHTRYCSKTCKQRESDPSMTEWSLVITLWHIIHCFVSERRKQERRSSQKLGFVRKWTSEINFFLKRHLKRSGEVVRSWVHLVPSGEFYCNFRLRMISLRNWELFLSRSLLSLGDSPKNHELCCGVSEKEKKKSLKNPEMFHVTRT